MCVILHFLVATLKNLKEVNLIFIICFKMYLNTTFFQYVTNIKIINETFAFF